jgi:hypothetical protein
MTTTLGIAKKIVPKLHQYDHGCNSMNLIVDTHFTSTFYWKYFNHPNDIKRGKKMYNLRCLAADGGHFEHI